ncbi:hypothetical protein RFI_11810, partial [Reticulomyxa filosa]
MAFLNQLQSDFAKKEKGSKSLKADTSDIDVTALFNMLQLSPFQSKHLVLDIRRPSEGRDSKWIQWSTKLSIHDKDKSVISLDEVSRLSQLDPESSGKSTLKYIDTLKVIIYGDNDKDYDVCQKIQAICTKHEKVNYCRILQGGYDAFFAKYPFLCVSNNKCPKYPNEIIENQLYLGTQAQSQNEAVILQHLRITHVVNVTENAPNVFVSKGVQYYRIPVNDLEDVIIKKHFEEAFKFIENAFVPQQTLQKEEKEDSKVDKADTTNGSDKHIRILVHCEHGISRSTTIVISYLMKKHKWTFNQALDFVVQKRPQVEPNVVGLSEFIDNTILKSKVFKHLICKNSTTSFTFFFFIHQKKNILLFLQLGKYSLEIQVIIHLLLLQGRDVCINSLQVLDIIFLTQMPPWKRFTNLRLIDRRLYSRYCRHIDI